ncbi:MAG: hypothetical protein AB7F19_06920 [Candidatus Babeliales bacterium]
MKKQIFLPLCVSIMLSAVTLQADPGVNSAAQLAATLEQAFFAPTSELQLSPQEMNWLANAALFMYLESYYVLRSHIAQLTDDLKHRKEVIEKTCTACLNYIAKEGSPKLQGAMQLLAHSTKTVKKSYLNKYQEELISGERDTFVHAQALQQITANLFGLWYKALYEGMQKYKFDENYFNLTFNVDGIIPAQALRSAMPTPNSLL